jgi:hypothetical protein
VSSSVSRVFTPGAKLKPHSNAISELRIGSTTFEIHLHKSSLSCNDCMINSSSNNLIPLLESVDSTTSTASAPLSNYVATKTKEEKEVERTEQMNALKAKFSIPPTQSKSKPKPKSAKKLDQVEKAETKSERKPDGGYVDRANARRLNNPIVASTSSNILISAPPSANSLATDPFLASSKGAQLLAKFGGGSNHSLGILIEPRTMAGQAKSGLGSKPLMLISDKTKTGSVGGEKRDRQEDRRENAKKRYKEI